LKQTLQIKNHFRSLSFTASLLERYQTFCQRKKLAYSYLNYRVLSKVFCNNWRHL